MSAETRAEREARLVLNLVGEPGDPRLLRLVAEIGATAALASLRSQVRDPQGREEDLGTALQQRLAAIRPAEMLQAAERRGLRFVTPADDEWPPVLADLADAPLLHERGEVPIGLWLRGPLRLDEAAAGAVAVVGSRSATTYGAAVAAEVAGVLADAAVPVVSGAAFGIDQAAHRGALAARGATVAVLACGADRVYPTAHRALLEYVADVGLVVSEAPPGGAPTRVRFLARNRLIAALSVGTVVVEAAMRSGALNTANWADGLSRTLMGVPGPVTSAASQGVHELVRARNALLVTSGADVLEAVSPAGRHLGRRASSAAHPRDALSGVQRQVLDAVPVRQGVAGERIARSAGLAPGLVAAVLEELHGAGFVERAAGRWRVVMQGTDAPATPGGAEFVP